jgi:hypothetical protein
MFELLAFRSTHPAHDTNAALSNIRVVCCHVSHEAHQQLRRLSGCGVSESSATSQGLGPARTSVTIEGGASDSGLRCRWPSAT